MKLEDNVRSLVHEKIKLRASDLTTVLDATLGNGQDTIFLARCMGEGTIVGFDIQEEAIRKTTEKMKEYPKITFLPILDSHSSMKSYFQHSFDLILFNLGYLPGGNKAITTLWESTEKGIRESLDLLKPGGLLSITAYPGHEEGYREWVHLKAMVKELDQKEFTIQQIEFPNQKNHPPKVFFIEKRLR